MAKRLRGRGAPNRGGTMAGRENARSATQPRTGTGPAAAGQDAVITIRSETAEQTVRRQASIERLADEWTYILRLRARWRDDEGCRTGLRDRAIDDLKHIGVPRPFLEKLALADRVEVELHPWADDAPEAVRRIHEAASAVPWEYLISAATRGLGRHGSILVTRLLRNRTPAPVNPPRRVLFIESAPGRLADAYDFDSERERIRAAVGAPDEDGAGSRPPDGRKISFSRSDDLEQLRTIAGEKHWDVLHVSGIDTHQAAWLEQTRTLYDELAKNRDLWNRIADRSGAVLDGMILREPNVSELPVTYVDLASALINPNSPPSLVTLNLYYSGARTARELVKRGAHAALGFLDEIDDELAERFFQAFYWEWCRPGGNCPIPHAFRVAWDTLTSDRLHGTAIVMWMGVSVFEDGLRRRAKERPRPSAAEARTAVRARLDSIPIRSLLQVQLDVPEEVNYSLLHNDRPLLTRLTLTKLVKEPLEDVSVYVELDLGAQNYPYRCTHIVLDEPQLALAPTISIPLTAALPRSLRERVQSTVYVKVTCAGRTVWETTDRVTLIPVDEWVDDTANNPWLPSFVLPRDPAILKIVASARRYLVGIRDDPAAGFDGYQAIDPKAPTPTEGVDAQVRAIWTALVNEYRLQYINPPPSYSKRNQRLRTPSDIVASNTATCIDLALMLASCLEYIDIYPVIVLLDGHAFVGYWRSEEAHESFTRVEQIPAEIPAPGSPVARSAHMRFVDEYGWRLTRLNYDEIMEYVTSGDLVMLEATYLTSASSFADGMEEGRANMRSRQEFDSLLDIRLARSAWPPVTPLPIIND